MKNISIALTAFILCICSGYTIISEDVEISRSVKHGDYTILYGKQGSDSIAFAVRTALIETCGKPKYVNTEGLKTVMSLEQFDGPDIIFTYTGYSSDQFPNGVSVGGGAPGQWHKLYIDTYYQFPFLIENCNLFRK